MKKIPWIVQIIISLTVVYLSFKYFVNDYDIDWVIISIFVVYIVVTLTIVPLATAVYYSAKTKWRIVFSIALIAVIISQFETIIQTLEYYSHNQSHSLTIETIILVAGILSLAGPLIAFIVVFVEDKKSRNK